jgi:replication-associated recombination protein RarA|tara:strand:- start:5158 stop:5898 length:741 start_codon:yes stop_codon:yes gene_type:complete
MKQGLFDQERYAWATIYRPQTINEMALAPSYREEFLMIEDLGYMPDSIILHGTPGVGKTTLAEILGKMEEYSYYEHNCGVDNNKGDFVNLVRSITSSVITGERKRIIFLDEFNNQSASKQQILNKAIEQHAATNTFIIATNDYESLTPQLVNRCSTYLMNFSMIDKKTGKLEVFTKTHGMTKADWVKELRRVARLVGKKTKVKIPTYVFEDVEQREENLVSVRGYMRAVSAGCMRHDYQIYKNKKK